jgi:chemotaxis protein MotB
MSRQNDVAPVIIIKRKKIVKGGGHHGGAWKVAYADFVTAMMAFFLMMWLLGATTESQRRGLADYFNPTIPVHRISSGGDGMFGGTDLETRAQQGPATPADDSDESTPNAEAETESFEELQARLNGLGGESPVLDQALRHILTRQTDEGLVLEIFDLPGAPLFENDGDEPTAIMRQITLVLSQVFSIIINPLAIEGHTRTYTVVQANDPRWVLSTARAERIRRLLNEEGFDPARMARVTGHADRRPSDPNPMAVRNNRLELILLRRAPIRD